MDSFLQFINSWMFISFGLGFFGMIFLVAVLRTKKENSGRTPVLIGVSLVGQCFLTFIITFTTLGNLKADVRREVLAFLKRPNLKVIIDGNRIDDSLRFGLLTDLKTLKSTAAHHSHTTTKFTVLLIDTSDTLSLNLEKDSDIGNEYWVFLNKYETTKTNEIGRITTDRLK